MARRLREGARLAGRPCHRGLDPQSRQRRGAGPCDAAPDSDAGRLERVRRLSLSESQLRLRLAAQQVETRRSNGSANPRSNRVHADHRRQAVSPAEGVRVLGSAEPMRLACDPGRRGPDRRRGSDRPSLRRASVRPGQARPLRCDHPPGSDSRAERSRPLDHAGRAAPPRRTAHGGSRRVPAGRLGRRPRRVRPLSRNRAPRPRPSRGGHPLPARRDPLEPRGRVALLRPRRCLGAARARPRGPGSASGGRTLLPRGASPAAG